MPHTGMKAHYASTSKHIKTRYQLQIGCARHTAATTGQRNLLLLILHRLTATMGALQKILLKLQAFQGRGHLQEAVHMACL